MATETLNKIILALFVWIIAHLAAQRAPILGKVVEMTEPCPTGPLAGTTCRRLQVSVSGMKTIEAQN